MFCFSYRVKVASVSFSSLFILVMCIPFQCIRTSLDSLQWEENCIGGGGGGEEGGMAKTFL